MSNAFVVLTGDYRDEVPIAVFSDRKVMEDWLDGHFDRQVHPIDSHVYWTYCGQTVLIEEVPHYE